jgi:hypothetical protein
MEYSMVKAVVDQAVRKFITPPKGYRFMIALTKVHNWT